MPVPHTLVRFFSAIALLAGVQACSKKETAAPPRGAGGPVPVEVAKVEKKDLPLDLRAIGNVEPIATVAIKAQVGGELLAVNFQEGQDVKKGDLLFTIQPKLYATQLAQVEANLARDRAQAANAEREAARSVDLSAKGAVSKEELEQTRSNSDAFAATVRADEASLEIARVQLGYATVKSPIDGRTGALNVQAGNLIKAGADDAMVTINQLAPIYVAFSVPENHLAAIRKGMTKGKMGVAALNPKSHDALAEGELTFISNAVDSTTGTILLKATFSNDDRALWPGAFVDVVLHLSADEGVTVVPTSSITIGQQGPQVFVVKPDGTAELRAIKTGRTVAREVIVNEGLQPDETVVVNGQSRLTPGAKVSVPEKPKTSNVEHPTSDIQSRNSEAGKRSPLPLA